MVKTICKTITVDIYNIEIKNDGTTMYDYFLNLIKIKDKDYNSYKEIKSMSLSIYDDYNYSSIELSYVVEIEMTPEEIQAEKDKKAREAKRRKEEKLKKQQEDLALLEKLAKKYKKTVV